MNNRIFFLILLLFPIFLYSQNDFKNIYYYKEDGNKITQSEFFRLNSSYDYISNSYEKESDLIKVLIKRKRLGTIAKDDYVKLMEVFPEVSFESNHYIVVEYVPSNPKDRLDQQRLYGYVYGNPFIKKIRSQKNVSLVYISDQMNFPKILKFQNKKRLFIKDEKNTFKNYFYPFEMQYHNVTIIRNDGKYITFLGEHSPDDVYKLLEELKKS